jgi:hypothetical protein
MISIRRETLRRLLSLLALCLLAAEPAMAQEECGDALNRAGKSYELGRFDETISQLVDCMATMNEAEKARAWRLLALSYAFTDRPEEADNAVLQMLEIDPHYLVNPAVDPPELQQLIDRYTIFPRLSIGARGSIAVSGRKVTDAFGVAGKTTPLELAGEKVLAFGSDLGAHFEFAASKSLILSQDILWSTRTVSYRINNRQPAIRTEYTERLIYLNLPISVRYQLDAGDFFPYVHLGYFTQLLLSASSDIQSVSDTSGAASGIRTTEDRRSSSNPGLVAGAGVNFALGDGFLVVEGRYEYGLTSVVIRKNRYTDLERAFQFLYLDNDYSLRNLVFQVGYTFPVSFSARK